MQTLCSGEKVLLLFPNNHFVRRNSQPADNKQLSQQDVTKLQIHFFLCVAASCGLFYLALNDKNINKQLLSSAHSRLITDVAINTFLIASTQLNASDCFAVSYEFVLFCWKD